MQPSINPQKRELSKKINEDVDKWVEAGNKIQVIPYGVTVDSPTAKKVVIPEPEEDDYKDVELLKVEDV